MTTTNRAPSVVAMTSQTAVPKRLVIVGATGMVGGYALRCALDSPAVKSVTSIGRKGLGLKHPKLKEVMHENFADCSALRIRSRSKTQPCIALGPTPGRFLTRNFAQSLRATRLSSRVFYAPAVLTPRFRF